MRRASRAALSSLHIRRRSIQRGGGQVVEANPGEQAETSRKPRYTIANVLWATVGSAVAFAFLNVEFLLVIVAWIGLSVVVSVFAAGILAAERGIEAFLDGFRVAMGFSLISLLAVAAILLAAPF